MSTPPTRSPYDDGSALRAAVVQMTSGDDRAANLERAGLLVDAAAARGARLVVLPERFAHLHGARTLAGSEPLEGATISAARSWARRHRIWLLAGSIAEAGAPDGRTHNTSVLLDPGGEIAALYRKLHLFDVEVGGRAYRESAATAPGSEVVTGEVGSRILGLSICYDLRFPELYRLLVDRGATMLAVPSAFTLATGRDHWDLLLRARAVENQCYVLGAGQFGTHDDGSISYGRSAIVDPWGTVIARVPDGEGVATAELDFAHLQGIRSRLPALEHRRQELNTKP